MSRTHSVVTRGEAELDVIAVGIRDNCVLIIAGNYVDGRAVNDGVAVGNMTEESAKWITGNGNLKFVINSNTKGRGVEIADLYIYDVHRIHGGH